MFSKIILCHLLEVKLFRRKTGPLGLPEPTRLAFWKSAELLRAQGFFCQLVGASPVFGQHQLIDRQVLSWTLPESTVDCAQVLQEGVPRSGPGRRGGEEHVGLSLDLELHSWLMM